MAANPQRSPEQKPFDLFPLSKGRLAWVVIFFFVLGFLTYLHWMSPDVSHTGKLDSLEPILPLAAWLGLLVWRIKWAKRDLIRLVSTAVILVFSAAFQWLQPLTTIILVVFFLQAVSLFSLARAILASLGMTLLVFLEPSLLSGALQPSTLLQLENSGPILIIGILSALLVIGMVRRNQERQKYIEDLEAAYNRQAAAERQAGILTERQRLAGEIHDTLAQGLASIVMHLEAAEQALPVDEAVVTQHLDQAKRSARENLAEARRFVWALQPEALDSALLPDALSRVVTQWSEESGVFANLKITGIPYLLLPEHHITLLRIAQEALTNIRNHAQANQVILTLSYMEDLVLLDIKDNGVGFDVGKDAGQEMAGGFGLVSIRRRIEQMGGKLEIESEPGSGTVIAVELPIAENKKRADLQTGPESAE